MNDGRFICWRLIRKLPKLSIDNTALLKGWSQFSSSQIFPFFVFHCRWSAPPVISQPLTDRTVVEGSTFSVECLSVAIPTASITWLHNGRPVAMTQRLTLSPVKISDGGTYICEANNTVGKATTTFSLTIEGNTELKRKILQSWKMFIKYKKDSSGVFAALFWPSKCVMLLFPTPKLPPSLLLLRKAYWCAFYWLCLAELPRIVTAPLNQTVIEASLVTLQCVVSGLPTPIVTWKLNNRPLPHLFRFALDSRGFLTITGILFQDAGNYTCIASNTAGVAAATAFVRVSSKCFQSCEKMTFDFVHTGSYFNTLCC